MNNKLFSTEIGATLLEVGLVASLIAVVAVAAVREVGYSTWETNFVAACSTRCGAFDSWYIRSGTCARWGKSKCRVEGLCHTGHINYLFNRNCQ